MESNQESNTFEKSQNIPRQQLYSLLILNSSHLSVENIKQEIKTMYNTNEFGISHDLAMNAIIQLNDTNTTLNMQSNRNFLSGFNKKLIGSKDKRPILIAKGLKYQTEISNFKNLQKLCFIEIISLENKFNNYPKAVKLSIICQL